MPVQCFAGVVLDPKDVRFVRTKPKPIVLLKIESVYELLEVTARSAELIVRHFAAAANDTTRPPKPINLAASKPINLSSAEPIDLSANTPINLR